jgi:hypothetical protein
MAADTERYERLLRSDWYTPDDLADLLDMSLNEIRRAVFENRLHATVIDGHIVEITRHDALVWLAAKARED